MGKFHRLACVERYQVEALIKSGQGVSAIARLLSRSKSSISREIKLGKTAAGYSASKAERKAKENSKRPKDLKIKGPLEVLIRDLLALDYSPEQISGWLKRKRKKISHETIYKFIYADRISGGFLWHHLRRRRRWRRKRGVRRPYAGCGIRIDRRSIEERPSVVNDRRRFGDFERDTMKGKDGVLLTVVDRKSKIVRIRSVKKNSGMPMHAATVDALKNLNPETITNDNGQEFCDHELTARELGVEIYFSHPYASWERGTNENINGLIRQYFTRQTNPTPELAQFIEDRLNNRPRKGLGYRTPNEVHQVEPERVAMAL